jgi:son of sevenless-like protein
MMRSQQAEAGPSTPVSHRHRSTSSPITSSPLHSPALSIHSGLPTHVQAIHDFTPALLASTSVATNPNMYLSFKNGEVIRVHARDATGWWDGEIANAHSFVDGVADQGRNGPRRGWFPSNYVREMGQDAVSDHAMAISLFIDDSELSSTGTV